MVEQEDDKQGKSSIDKKEWEAINNDINSAKESLVSKDTEAKIKAAKEEARKEAEKEFMTNQEIQKLKEENARLQQEREAKETEAAEKISAIQSKVDELVGSKAPSNNEDPFSNQNKDRKGIDNWTEEEVNNYEEKHAKAFFGEEQYSRMMSQR